MKSYFLTIWTQYQDISSTNPESNLLAVWPAFLFYENKIFKKDNKKTGNKMATFRMPGTAELLEIKDIIGFSAD